MKVVNFPIPVKKGSVFWTNKLKSAKRSDDSFETCSDLVPYQGGLPPIGSIVLKSSPPPFACTYSSRRSIASKPKTSTLASPSSTTHGNKRKTSPLAPFATAKRRICYL